MDDKSIRCRGQCGLAVGDDDAALRAGWSYLQITGGWRCGACERALAVAASIAGHNRPPGADTLQPGDRGALKRETASTILPPSVKS